MSKRNLLGEAIKKARLDRKLSQDQLADRVGARGGRFTVIRWEQGLNKPVEFAPQLVETLGLDESLFDDEEDSSLALTRDEQTMFFDLLGKALRVDQRPAVKA